MAALRSDVRLLDSNLASCRESIERGNRGREALEVGLQKTNSHVGRLNSELESNIQSMSEIRREFGEMATDSRAIQEALESTRHELHHESHTEKDYMKQQLLRLTEQSDQMSRDFDELKTCLERTDASLLDAWKGIQDGNKKFPSFESKMQAVSEKLAKVVADTETATNQRKEMNRLILAADSDNKMLRKGLENVDSLLSGLQQSHGSTVQNVKDLNVRMTKTLEDINSIMNDCDAEKHRQNESNANLAKFCQRIDYVQSNLQDTTKQLHDTGRNVEALQNHNEEINTAMEKMDGKIAELMKSHRKAANCITSLTHELEKTGELLSSTEERLDSATKTLNATRTELTKTNGNVSRLGVSVDECQSSLTGFTSGLEDMHNHVATEGAMLPPKGQAVVPTLPSLVTPKGRMAMGQGSQPQSPHTNWTDSPRSFVAEPPLLGRPGHDRRSVVGGRVFVAGQVVAAAPKA